MEVSNQIVDTTALQEAITGLDLTDMEALNKFLVERIKHQRTVKAQSMKRQLFVGSKVSFEDNDGRTAQGKIIKVMRKFAKVDTGANIWRVPLSQLTKVV